MNGIIAAISTSAALGGVLHIAGADSALTGALQYGSGIIHHCYWLSSTTVHLDNGLDYCFVHACQFSGGITCKGKTYGCLSGYYAQSIAGQKEGEQVARR